MEINSRMEVSMAILSHKELLSSIGVAAGPGALLSRLLEAVGGHRLAFRRWRDRTAAIRQLSRFDERLLQDIGLQRGELAPLLEQGQRRETAARWPQRWPR